ncbi:alpha-ribazole phosphatase [Sporocytophaga myxococcoides]|uniref:Alpha-ribazole phosphatase n=1 Tax=Sporocytophaga myxococcoides TaxID=153721 RepID=A0A098LIA2_9BACT|nr:histidine phosphatase family protein [Sporocytophaga myxococcoides]GAL86202.1 alpha-ribazole phosphatase [Sporocytophaga myxococcoides]
MKIHTIFFSLALLIAPGFSKSKGKNDSPKSTIERIEKKYDALSKTAPVIKANGKPMCQSLRFIQEDDNLVKDYSKLRQIAIIRHGEPDMVKTGQYTCTEANQFLKCYDSVCIIVPEKPFFELGANEEVEIFSSPLNRALSTAHYLFGTERAITVSPYFREFENTIKESDSKKKYSIKRWKTTARIKWMLGISKPKNIESFSQAKDRAKKGAAILDEASNENAKVVLTAHGLLNRYLKKDLKKMGWKVVEDTGNDYFGTTILVKLDE